MYTIDVYLYDNLKPDRTFTCNAVDMPKTLKDVERYVDRNPFHKITVNGNCFNSIPTLNAIKLLPTGNPILVSKFKSLMEKYPIVNSVGFNGHDNASDNCDCLILVMAVSKDTRVLSDVTNALELLYGNKYEAVASYITTVGVTGYDFIYTRGVDF